MKLFVFIYRFELMDAVGPGFLPQPNVNAAWVMLYVVLLIFGFFTVMNIFIAIIIEAAFEERNKVLGITSDEQAEWVDL